jgi:hypothetical protein
LHKLPGLQIENCLPARPPVQYLRISDTDFAQRIVSRLWLEHSLAVELLHWESDMLGTHRRRLEWRGLIAF